MNLYALVAWVDNYGEKYPKIIFSDTSKGNVIEQFKFIKNLCESPLACNELKLIREKLIKLSLYVLSFNGVELMECYDFEQKDENNAIQEKLENDMKNIDKEELKELLKN